MTKRITLDDIAAAAHVSKATVSKALNDTGQLSAHTRRLILKTADELGYVKTANVQTPRCKTGLIGLVTSDLEGRFSNPALIGAENTLGSTNHAVLLTNSRGDPNSNGRISINWRQDELTGCSCLVGKQIADRR